MKIITYPNQILAAKAQEIDLADFDIKKLQKLIKNMIKTMHKANGVGLAAPQVGYSLRLCAIRQVKNDLVLINPIIIACSKQTAIMEEGCLSLPKVQINIERYNWLKIKTVNFEDRSCYLEASGLLARVIQHEIDHLDGVLITDK